MHALSLFYSVVFLILCLIFDSPLRFLLTPCTPPLENLILLTVLGILIMLIILKCLFLSVFVVVVVVWWFFLTVL